MKKPTRTVRYYDIHCDSCGKKINIVRPVKVTRKHKGEDITQTFEVCETCAKIIEQDVQYGAGKYNKICEEMLHNRQEVDTVTKYEFLCLVDMENYHEYEYHTEPVKLN